MLNMQTMTSQYRKKMVNVCGNLLRRLFNFHDCLHCKQSLVCSDKNTVYAKQLLTFLTAYACKNNNSKFGNLIPASENFYTYVLTIELIFSVYLAAHAYRKIYLQFLMNK